MADSPVTTAHVELPLGVWSVDPSAGELTFSARGFFGLAKVRGRFGSYDGELEVGADGVRGELRIQAATLETGMTKRDTHLHSADFFDVQNHPTVTFTPTNVSPTPADGLNVTGVLQIRETSLEVTAPLEVTHSDENHLHLHTALSVDRSAAGVGWSKMGMIKGPAELDATLVLTRRP
jgi:polyisoprenoid-binding protein YceI